MDSDQTVINENNIIDAFNAIGKPSGTDARVCVSDISLTETEAEFIRSQIRALN